MHELLKNLASIKLAVVLFGLIALACILGTMIPQQAESSWYSEHYGPVLARILIRAGITDVFRTLWFAALLGLLGVNLLACTVVRKPWAFRHLGFLLTHAGVLVLLAGTLVSVLASEKGRLSLRIGESTTQYYSLTAKGPQSLGFLVQLDHFEIERYPNPAYLWAHKPDQPPQMVELDRQNPRTTVFDQYAISLVKVIPDFHLQTVIKEDPAETFAPLAHLRTSLSYEPLLLNGLSDDGVYSEDGRLYLRYRWLDDSTSLETELVRLEDASEPMLHVSTADQTASLPTHPGARCTLAKSGLHVEVIHYWDRFRLDENNQPASADTGPINPCALVQATLGEYSRSHYVFSRFPDFGIDSEDDPPYRLRLTVPAGHGAALHAVIFEGNNLAPTLILIKDNQVIDRRPLARHKRTSLVKSAPESLVRRLSAHPDDCCDSDGPEPLPGEAWIELLDTYRRPSVRREVVSRSDALVNPAALLRIEGPDGPVERWSLMFGRPVRSLDGTLQVRFVLPEIKSYRSFLTFRAPGRTPQRATVEVNSPFRFGRFTFYQTGADPNDPTWSVFQVVHDPGIPVVYAGLIIVSIGIIVVFSLKPIWTENRER